jgi:hypothetical protein
MEAKIESQTAESQADKQNGYERKEGQFVD